MDINILSHIPRIDLKLAKNENRFLTHDLIH